MSTDIRSTAANAAANMVAAPGYVWDAAGHTGVFWLGAPVAKAAKNRRSLAAASATIAGTPVESPYFLTLGGATQARLVTDVMDAAQFTVISVARLPLGNNTTVPPASLVSNYQGTTPRGFNMSMNRVADGRSQLTTYLGVTDGTTEAQVVRSLYLDVAPGDGKWRLLASVVKTGVAVQLFDRTGNTAGTETAETRAYGVAGRPFAIGGGGFFGTHDQAFVGIVPAVMTPAQIDDAMVKPRLFLSEIAGITV